MLRWRSGTQRNGLGRVTGVRAQSMFRMWREAFLCRLSGRHGRNPSAQCRRPSGRRKPVRLQERWRRGSTTLLSFPPPCALFGGQPCPWRRWSASAVRGQIRPMNGRICTLGCRICYPGVSACKSAAAAACASSAWLGLAKVARWPAHEPAQQGRRPRLACGVARLQWALFSDATASTASARRLLLRQQQCCPAPAPRAAGACGSSAAAAADGDGVVRRRWHPRLAHSVTQQLRRPGTPAASQPAPTVGGPQGVGVCSIWRSTRAPWCRRLIDLCSSVLVAPWWRGPTTVLWGLPLKRTPNIILIIP